MSRSIPIRAPPIDPSPRFREAMRVPEPTVPVEQPEQKQVTEEPEGEAKTETGESKRPPSPR
jgi:hypothetical protein